MDTMKKYMPILLLVPILVACNQKKVDELTAEKEELSTQKQQLNQELESYMKTFNEIEANLKEIKEREEVINLNRSNVESDNPDTREAVVRDIQAINALMAENKEKIDELQSKLNSTSGEFNRMVANLNRRIKEKEEQLTSMKKDVEQLREEKQQLTANVDSLSTAVDTLSNIKSNQSELISQQKERLERQMEELNTGYVAIGSYKDLKEKDILTKEGGILGIGQTEKLRDNFNKDAFNRVNITQVNSIPIGTKKMEIITAHPHNSYELSMNDNKIEELVIVDPQKFWNSSRYLVIEVK